MTHRERFAPSPTGPLHLGHAYSAITAWNNALRAKGTFLLRIEDIDQSRARPDWEELIYEDLTWLGLDWPQPVLRQSSRTQAYRHALQTLWDQGLLYPCHCNRRDIQEALRAPQEAAPLTGPDGVIYPGTCRRAPTEGRPEGVTLRLNMGKAVERLGKATIEFTETGPKTGTKSMPVTEMATTISDVVLARKDMGTSYHLSVVLDDARQGITHVTRGLDLSDATPIHVLLQRLLDLPTPIYHHHALIRDAAGKRLAKRDDAKAIDKFRKDGATPQDIYKMIGITPLARQ